jgi:AraC family transcriptional regulator
MMDSNVLEFFGNEPQEFEPGPGTRDRADSPRLLISLERSRPHRPIIHKERKWRLVDKPDGVDQRVPRLVVSRWRGADRDQHSFEIAGDYHILAVILQPTRLSLRVGPRSFQHQDVVPGVIQITPPGLPADIVYARPYDILHFYIPNALLMECFDWSHGKWPTDGVALRDPMLAPDALLEKLGTTLLSIDGADGCLFADFLGLAIVTHLLRLYGEVSPPSARKITALPRWRLKRVTEFIEAHLDRPVALADVAGAAGLSCMHFAAQFRAATGIRPHEYLVRRRIAKAQTMLATTDMPIAELALAVGFGSQAHFTVVFKRFSGLTPLRWRQSHCLR